MPRSGHGVTLVDLRRAAVDHTIDTTGDGSGTGNGREYRHRWVVRGHWRQQPHGPQRSQRRPVWIESHLKGPAGGPLLATDQVRVWRR